jgi:hypothetical protein
MPVGLLALSLVAGLMFKACLFLVVGEVAYRERLLRLGSEGLVGQAAAELMAPDELTRATSKVIGSLF